MNNETTRLNGSSERPIRLSELTAFQGQPAAPKPPRDFWETARWVFLACMVAHFAVDLLQRVGVLRTA